MPGDARGRQVIPLVEFDLECMQCKKRITVRVRDDLARVFVERIGALCEVCYTPGYRPAPTRWAA